MYAYEGNCAACRELVLSQGGVNELNQTAVICPERNNHVDTGKRSIAVVGQSGCGIIILIGAFCNPQFRSLQINYSIVENKVISLDDFKVCFNFINRSTASR